jgi:hypothetical protein
MKIGAIICRASGDHFSIDRRKKRPAGRETPMNTVVATPDTCSIAARTSKSALCDEGIECDVDMIINEYNKKTVRK